MNDRKLTLWDTAPTEWAGVYVCKAYGAICPQPADGYTYRGTYPTGMWYPECLTHMQLHTPGTPMWWPPRAEEGATPTTEDTPTPAPAEDPLLAPGATPTPTNPQGLPLPTEYPGRQGGRGAAGTEHEVEVWFKPKGGGEWQHMGTGMVAWVGVKQTVSDQVEHSMMTRIIERIEPEAQRIIDHMVSTARTMTETLKQERERWERLTAVATPTDLGTPHEGVDTGDAQELKPDASPT